MRTLERQVRQARRSTPGRASALDARLRGALDEALARREERVLSKALTFSVGGKVCCVKTNGPGTALRGARVTLLHF